MACYKSNHRTNVDMSFQGKFYEFQKQYLWVHTAEYVRAITSRPDTMRDPQTKWPGGINKLKYDNSVSFHRLLLSASFIYDFYVIGYCLKC